MPAPDPIVEVCESLKDNLDAEDRALEADDMVAYRALVEREARLMDILKASWKK